MNLFWNVVNATIAGIALSNNLGYDCSSVSYDSYLNSHLSTEKTLLINSALDVGYIGTGFLLKYFSTKASQRNDLLKGYGNSLILQGGFLLAFDVVLYALMRNERISFDTNISASFSPSLPALHFVHRFWKLTWNINFFHQFLNRSPMVFFMTQVVSGLCLNGVFVYNYWCFAHHKMKLLSYVWNPTSKCTVSSSFCWDLLLFIAVCWFFYFSNSIRSYYLFLIHFGQIKLSLTCKTIFWFVAQC